MKDEILKHLIPITEEERAILNGKGAIDRNIYMDSENNIINAKKMLERGKLIALRPHTRFARFPEHTHDYIEMVYMCQGKTTHVINGNRITVSQGETLILNQHARQEILPAGKDDIAVNFIILPQFFHKALEMLGEEETPLRHFIVDCICGRENPLGYLYFKTDHILTIQNLFENLIYTFIHNEPNQRKTNEFTMGLLLLQFINHSHTLVYENKEESAVIQVLKYIEENYQQGSLSQAAKLLHYDFYWLSREIKRKTGKNYTLLLQEKRLSQAAYLLSVTNLRVLDIASAVGYHNMSYFYRIFEEKFGISPREYRKNR